jgi:hypothetical protein
VARKNLLRTGVMAVALTLGAMLIPATHAMADSGGGCGYSDSGSPFEACISVRSGTTNPLIGDAYDVSDFNLLITYAEIYLVQSCPGNGFTSQPTRWNIPGPHSHSPTLAMNHLGCPGQGFAYTYMDLYESNGQWVDRAQSPYEYF